MKTKLFNIFSVILTAIMLVFVAIVLLFSLTACGNDTLYDYRKSELADLQAYAASEAKKYDYTQYGQEKIETAINEAKKAINNAKTYSEIDYSIKLAKYQIDTAPVCLKHNAIANFVSDKKPEFKEAFFDTNLATDDASSWSKYAIRIVNSQEELAEIYEVLPEIDFANTTLTVIQFTSFYNRSNSVRGFDIVDGILKVEIGRIKIPKQPSENLTGIPPHPYWACWILKSDKLDVTEGNVLFV